jgi:hemolysin III
LPALASLSLLNFSNPRQVVAMVVFVATMMLLYLSSALFHGLPGGRGKQFFAKLDHSAIYLFIAGSYTPFAASSLQGGVSWPMLAMVWGLALAGVVVTLCNWIRHAFWSTSLYVALGWLVLVAAIPCIERGPALSLHLLVGGGVAYTLGAALFLLGARVRFAHLIWHLCVMLGSGLHFAAMLTYS